MINLNISCYSTFFQLLSGSKVFIAFTVFSVFLPRSFSYTSPSWFTMNVLIPAGRFDNDDLFLDLHDLFFGRFQVARCLCLCPKRLYGIHNILLLGEKGVAHLLRPVEFFT